MADPLTALMYAVQVMNFLRTLIERTLKEREDSAVEPMPPSILGPEDDSGPHGPSLSLLDREANNNNHDEGEVQAHVPGELALDSSTPSPERKLTTESSPLSFLDSIENIIPCRSCTLVNDCPCEIVSKVNSLVNAVQDSYSAGPSGKAPKNNCESKPEQLGSSDLKKGLRKAKDRHLVMQPVEKEVGVKASILGRSNSRVELTEAWR